MAGRTEQLNKLLRETLLFIGDLNGMDKRLSELRNRAKVLGIDVSDLPVSKNTLQRLRDEAYDIRLKTGDALSD